MYDIGSTSSGGNEKSFAWVTGWILYACSVWLKLYVKDFNAIGNLAVRTLVQLLYAGAFGYVLIVMVTGYRGYANRDTVIQSIRRFIPLWMYSFFLCIAKGVLHARVELFEDYFPVINEIYDVMTIYVLVTILGEYLQIFVEKIEKRLLERLLVTMFVLWTIWPTMFGGDMYGQRVGVTVFAYLAGAYAAKNEEELREKRNGLHMFQIILLVILLIGTWIITILADDNVFMNPLLLSNMTSPIVYLLSFSIVCLSMGKWFPRLTVAFGSTCMGAFWIYGNPVFHGSWKRFAVMFFVAHCLEAFRLIAWRRAYTIWRKWKKRG